MHPRTVLGILLAVGVIVSSPDASAQISSKAHNQRTLKELRRSLMMDPKAALTGASGLEIELKQQQPTDANLAARAETIWVQAEAELRLENYPRAKSLLDLAEGTIRSVDGATKVRADIELSRGALAMKQDDAAGALAHLHSAFNKYRQSGDGRGQSVALQNIAALYTIANDNIQAEKYYREAGEVYDGDVILSIYLGNNLGNVLLQLERYKDAEQQYSKALKGAEKIGSKTLQARVYGNLARSRLESGDLVGSGRFLQKGFQDAVIDDDSIVLSTLMATKARLLFQRGNYFSAKKVVDRLFALTEKQTRQITTLTTSLIRCMKPSATMPRL